MKAANNTLSSLLLLCVCRFGAHAKEIIATNEWQKVGPTDTVPAGLEIRMDLSGGGKWARLPPPEEEEDISQPPHAKHCGPSCKERQKQRAEKRRAAGFKLREASHTTTRRRQHEEEELSGFSESPSILHVAGVLMLGLTIGLGVATRFRRKLEGLHEN